MRATAFHMPLRRGTGLSANERQAVSLKNLAKCVLQKEIQVGAHSAEEDAAGTMALYQSVKTKWEREVKMGINVFYYKRNRKATGDGELVIF